MLESIARQSFYNYEIIISDDSTNDDVKTLVENYGFEKKLRNPRHVVSPPMLFYLDLAKATLGSEDFPCPTWGW